MEKLDLYDINKVRTGKTYNRGERVPEGYYRLVVHCCIFNKEGKLLIQKEVGINLNGHHYGMFQLEEVLRLENQAKKQ